MVKRIVTKIGNIFCAEIDGEYKCYFQYIANDLTQLNSSVIRVFKRHYPLSYVPDFEEIVKDEISFYAHTVLSVGIRLGYWEKVGSHKDIGDIDDITFRLVEEIEFRHIKKSVRWYIWRINQPYIFIGELSDKYRKADLGMVYSCIEIVHKIKKGFYSFSYPDG